MKLVVDMNLSPRWIGILADAGVQALHWSTVGKANAPDAEIMAWVVANDDVVLTHDLDFGAILAATHGVKPGSLSDLKEIGCESAWTVHISPQGESSQNLSSPSRTLRASAARLACLTLCTLILQVRQAARVNCRTVQCPFPPLPELAKAPAPAQPAARLPAPPCVRFQPLAGAVCVASV